MLTVSYVQEGLSYTNDFCDSGWGNEHWMMSGISVWHSMSIHTFISWNVVSVICSVTPMDLRPFTCERSILNSKIIRVLNYVYLFMSRVCRLSPTSFGDMAGMFYLIRCLRCLTACVICLEFSLSVCGPWKRNRSRLPSLFYLPAYVPDTRYSQFMLSVHFK